MNLALNATVQEVGVCRKWEGDRQGTVKGHFYLASEKSCGKIFQIFYAMTRAVKRLEFR